MKYSRLALLVSIGVSLGILGGCAVVPTGPSVMALPGTGKSFDQFRADDGSCRQFAFGQVGGVTTNQAATNSAVGSAVVGVLFASITTPDRQPAFLAYLAGFAVCGLCAAAALLLCIPLARQNRSGTASSAPALEGASI